MALVLLLALAVLRGAIYVTVVPPWDLIDEEQHFHYVQYIVEERRLPMMGDTYLSPEVVASISETDRWGHFHLRRPPIAGVRITELEGYSYQAYHPPLYYVVSALPYTLLPADTLTKLYGLRFFSVALSAMSLALAYLVFRRILVGTPGLAIAAAALLSLIPEHTLAMNRVNNEVLAELLSTATLLVLVTSGEGRMRYPRVLLLGVLLGLAILTKLSAAVLVPLALLVLAWQAYRARSLGQFMVGAGIVLATVGIMIGWLLARNLALYGDPTGAAAFLRLARFVPKFTFSSMITELSRGFWMTRWEGLVPNALAAVMLGVGVIALAGLARGAIRSRRAGNGGSSIARWHTVLLLVSVAVWLVPLWWGVRSGLIQWVEGRFVVAAYAPVVGLLMIGFSGLLRPRGRALATAILLAIFLVADSAYLFAFSLPYYYFQHGFDPAAFFTHKPAFMTATFVAIVAVAYSAVLLALCWQMSRQIPSRADGCSLGLLSADLSSNRPTSTEPI